MATVVNTTPAAGTDNNGIGFFLGILLFVVVVILFFIYVLPYVRSGFGGAQVNIPSKIDVNVHQPGK